MLGVTFEYAMQEALKMANWWRIQRDWSMLGWSVVMFAGTILQSFNYLQNWQETRSLDKTATKTRGEITYVGGGGEDPYLTEYSFRARNGKEYVGRSNMDILEDELLEIEYLQSDPKINRVTGDRRRDGTGIMLVFLLGFLGLLFFSLGYTEETKKWFSNESQRIKLDITPFERFPIVILCAASACMLFVARDETHPYVFYQVLRVLVSATAIMLSIYAYRWGYTWMPWGFGILAGLFNPLVPFHFSRHAWSEFDLVAGTIMLSAAFWFKSPPTKELEENLNTIL
ncbi:DUF6804 family protein [Bythopirellula goksoeyrii]|uniref:Uncharacterized protein n=1 Tax=Bythopirellula goksoeyrii TaxID=1400387 RepID=A0A5B9Q7Z7_9BACT|nr:DUF6804 family protein [Bythopirellula goksoeyrii]QEG35108.1 hypothetical protein Pr1d_23990 [Bythopirellula goksoeyrii]